MHNSSLISGLHTLGIAAILASLLMGCESIVPANGRLEQDVLEIKTRLHENLDRQASMERMLDTQLNALSQKLETSSNLSATTLDEMQRQLRSQADEINKLSGQIESLNYAVKGTHGPAMPPDYGTMNPSGSTMTTSSAEALRSTNPPTSVGGLAVDQAYIQGMELYNSGQYAQAREAFNQALSQNPTGDKRVDIMFGLGETCMKLNDLDGAKESYKEVINTNRKHIKAWSSLERLADIDIAQGNKAGAIEKLEHFEKFPKYSTPAIQQKLARLRSGGGGANAPAATPEQ